MHGRAAICLVAILAAAGCQQKRGPDENYQKASHLYQALYASELDDAYGDPKMDEVVALLGKVDAHSIDADAAEAMKGSIQRGRDELAKQRAAREKMAAAAQAAAAAPVAAIDTDKILAAYAVDAGPAQDPYGAGALVSEINAQTGGCLSSYEPFNERGTNVNGVIYRLVPGAGCAGKLPGFVGQAVLVVNGKIYRRMEDPNPPAPPAPAAAADAGTAAAPADAGAPKVAAKPAAPAPAAVDAGEPEYQIVVPGQPLPGATPPPAERQQ